MKEIKFRAWEKTLKQMIPVYSIDFKKRIINSDSAWRFFDEVELMQFTWTLDKNGVEIFEGDIIHVPYNRIGNRQVVFEDGAFSNKMYDLSQVEVVGNVYENPKLLRG